MNKNANYRKYTDRSQNSSTYHKKDGTNIRAKLKEEARKDVLEDVDLDDELRIWKLGENKK